VICYLVLSDIFFILCMKKLYQRVDKSPSCKSGQLQWQTEIWVVSEIVCGLNMWGGILARVRISLIFRLTCVLTLTPIQWVLASRLPRPFTVWWLALDLHIQNLLGLNDCMKISDHIWRIVIACHNPSSSIFITTCWLDGLLIKYPPVPGHYKCFECSNS